MGAFRGTEPLRNYPFMSFRYRAPIKLVRLLLPLPLPPSRPRQVLDECGAVAILCNYKDVARVLSLARRSPALRLVVYTRHGVEHAAPPLSRSPGADGVTVSGPHYHYRRNFDLWAIGRSFFQLA